MIDGVAYRFQIATMGLPETVHGFRPVDSSMNMKELLNHIYILAYTAATELGVTVEKENNFDSIDTARNAIYYCYIKLSQKLNAITNILFECKKCQLNRI